MPHFGSHSHPGKEFQMKSLRELMEIVGEENLSNKRNHSNNTEAPLCIYHMPEVEMRVLSDGRVFYAADKRKTSFKLSDCLSYRYSTGENGMVLTYKDFADLDWVTWTCLYGEQRLEHNSDSKFSQTFCGMQESDSLSQTDYIRDKGEELLVDPSYTPEQWLIQRESVEEIISCLSERHKEFARLRFLHNLSLAETAIKMNCSYSAAAKIDSRIRKKIRENFLAEASKKSNK